MIRSACHYQSSISQRYNPVGTPSWDDDDSPIDFQNAVLYVSAAQVIFATVLCSFVSLLCCWSLPPSAVSTIRTLVLSSLTAALVVRRPFRLGKVHGLHVVFNALRPCGAIYIASQIAEQLVHTCTRDVASPSWRRIVFHGLIIVCILSGFARARRPLQETDAPFLATSISLFLIAMLPPPAVLLSGPLCSSPTISTGAERIVRSFVFSCVYCVFVYTSSPPFQNQGEILLCVMRAGSASIWTLACHALLLPLAVVQCAVVIFVRINQSQEKESSDREELERLTPSRQPASPPSRSDMESIELGAVNNALPSNKGAEGMFSGVVSSSTCSSSSSDPSNESTIASDTSQQQQPKQQPQQPQQQQHSQHSEAGMVVPGPCGLIAPTFNAIGPRTLVDIGGTVNVCDANSGTGHNLYNLTNEQLEIIAARVTENVSNT